MKKAKKKAWIQFSRYIRLKYAKNGFVKCYTCSTVKHWKEMQAGHGIGGRSNAVLFNEDIVRPQCLTKESKIRMAGGKYKSIANVKTNDGIWAFKENTFEKELAVVLATESFVPDELYKVELYDGSSFFATADHQVVSNGKWVRIDCMLHNVSEHDILQI